MIRLNVEPYCHECGEFEPTAESETIYALEKGRCRNTIVRCIHESRCRSIVEHLEKSKEDDHENN